MGDPGDASVEAAQRDPAAFAPLYRRYRDRVFAYLRGRTDNDEDAADLTQQVFLQALDGLPCYRGGGDAFAPWLFRIARNIATNFHGRSRKTVAWEDVPEALQPLTEADADAGLLRREDLIRVRHLLALLPPETRELLALRFGARLSTPIIAAVIGKSEAATRKQLSRAVQALQEHYNDES